MHGCISVGPRRVQGSGIVRAREISGDPRPRRRRRSLWLSDCHGDLPLARAAIVVRPRSASAPTSISKSIGISATIIARNATPGLARMRAATADPIAQFRTLLIERSPVRTAPLPDEGADR